MKDRIPLVLAVGAVFLVGAVYFFMTDRAPGYSYESQRTTYEGLINRLGPGAAYASFRDSVITIPIERQHLLAHTFGDALYGKEGIESFKVCGQDFGFGCYHAVSGHAIAEYGTEVIKDLDIRCVEAYGTSGLGCFHGLGHGVLAYYGYGIPELKKALIVCESLSWQRPYGGCPDGVFMEYDFRTMAEAPEERGRRFSPEEWEEPCPSVSERFREACYFSRPAWWRSSLHPDGGLPPGLADTLGAYCTQVKGELNQAACYRGIGHALAPNADFNPARGSKACDELSPTRAVVYCREGLAWAFYADPSLRGEAEAVCSAGLPLKEAAMCKGEYLFVIQ